MKTSVKLILAILFIQLFHSSCTVTKRVHRPGWHIEWHKNKTPQQKVRSDASDVNNDAQDEAVVLEMNKQLLSSRNDAIDDLHEQDNTVEVREVNYTELEYTSSTRDDYNTDSRIQFNEQNDSSKKSSSMDSERDKTFVQFLLFLGLFIIAAVVLMVSIFLILDFGLSFWLFIFLPLAALSFTLLLVSIIRMIQAFTLH